MIIPILGISLQQLFLLYFLELISLIYLIKKYNKSMFYVLIILFFYTAIFSFLGKEIQNTYRIIMLIMTLWISFQQKVFSKFKKGDGLITFAFVLFSLFYFYSISLNKDSILIALSQFSRYIIVYCLWFLVRKEIYTNYDNFDKFKQLIYDVFLIQIIITVGKLFIFGGSRIENIVGTIAHKGGSDGTTIPIIGFIMLWFYRKGKIKTKDWLYVSGLMLVGLLAGKRAVWFIIPLVITAFMIYVPKLKINKTLIVALVMSPLAFYLGARLTPNMNPENKIWGSFDIEYVFDFANNYQFGYEWRAKVDKRAQGRGGATLLLWDKVFNPDVKFTSSDWYGIGITQFYGTGYDDFEKLNTGINNKGASSGVFQTYITTGFASVLTTLFFYLVILWQIKMKRIRWVLIGIIGWEYIMYIGNIFRTPAYMFMIIYFIHYSNFLLLRRYKVPRITDSKFLKNDLIVK
jgi:hypothetical protein